ncbi:MAG: hypothetical protein ABEL76_06820, partial [Bradymonadaceae bacterium]
MADHCLQLGTSACVAVAVVSLHVDPASALLPPSVVRSEADAVSGGPSTESAPAAAEDSPSGGSTADGAESREAESSSDRTDASDSTVDETTGATYSVETQ